ncbi:Hypothetical predicted protein [Octopus vulgaris]|uniref:Uncharacterized protein n=1 Tax=Octopus vulgaris TaxID=6645 RepID=A0AA36AI23_OCTVU|nr:Hypothetical predicted protein [Octopus vulgaris]
MEDIPSTSRENKALKKSRFISFGEIFEALSIGFLSPKDPMLIFPTWESSRVENLESESNDSQHIMQNFHPTRNIAINGMKSN